MKFEIFQVGPRGGWRKWFDFVGTSNDCRYKLKGLAFDGTLIAAPDISTKNKAIVCYRNDGRVAIRFVDNHDSIIDNCIKTMKLPENQFSRKYAFVPECAWHRVGDKRDTGKRIIIQETIWNTRHPRHIHACGTECHEYKIVEWGTSFVKVKRVGSKELLRKKIDNKRFGFEIRTGEAI